MFTARIVRTLERGRNDFISQTWKTKTNKILRHWICLRAGVTEYTQGNKAKHLKFSPSDSEIICRCLPWKSFFCHLEVSAYRGGHSPVLMYGSAVTVLTPWRQLTDKDKSSFWSQFLVALSTITCYYCFETVEALSGGWSVQQSKTTHLTTSKKK